MSAKGLLGDNDYPIPIGCMTFYCGNNPPSGWLKVAGQELEISKYPALYDILGTQFGTPSDPANFLLPNVAGSDTGSDTGGGGTQPADVPTSLSWTEPQENTDGSELTDLASYRFYYGSSPASLSAIPSLDLPASLPNPGSGATVTHVFTSADIATITPLVANNTTHHFAVASLNSLGVESTLSEIVQYIP